MAQAGRRTGPQLDAARRRFLVDLIDAPAPSGYEQPVREVWRGYVEGFADEVRVDVHGNVIASRNLNGAPRLMLAGHCDELGFQANYISDDGFIYFNTVGGHDASLIPGRRVVVHTAQGPVLGVTGRKAVHLTPRSERGNPIKVEDIWIDIGAQGREAAERLVRVGDPITYNLGMQDLQDERAAARAFDNKIGAWVVAEALRRVDARKLSASVHAVATVQEEVGLRGAQTSAFGLNPAVGVAVDVTHASDSPGIDKRITGEIKLGAGPVITRGANVNPGVERLLLETACDLGMDVQIEAEPGGTGTDANAMQLAQAGVATGLVSVPLRYMHSPSEVIALPDANQCADLLAAFAARVTDEVDFTP